MKLIAVFLGFAAFAIAGFAQPIDASAAGASDHAMTPAQLTQLATQLWDGKHTYEVSCSSCHGDWGQGIRLFGPPLKGDAFVVHAPESLIAKTIQDGRQGPYKHFRAYSGMPRFQYLRGGKLLALIAYLKGGLQTATEPSDKSQ